ncbi:MULTISPECIES: M20 family metallo-hydrolase [unclassified Mesorhizobium]|uniref:M20 family metallo-hydrolase n=1 Tax=unclassified Mesorhizobium TaxID=325217 RepID=UPI00143F91DD|nr:MULTISPECIES: M20 family metallo-hydrolase [unclassified Mesorhizobium]
MLTIDAQRFMGRHESLAKWGATGKGGVNRPALSADETGARRELLDWARRRGFAIYVDPIGNLFVRRQGRSANALPIRMGSHLDSQMPGGNYDGVYGVLAAFEVLETLEDNAVTVDAPLELVIWNNEEGCRFSPTTMGSAVHGGSLSLDQALSAVDREGITVGQALERSLPALGSLTPVDLGSPCSGYIEAHIEQGPVLEALGLSVGVVSGIQGIAQFVFEVEGEEAHAGTTPRNTRRDALRGAISLVEEMASAIEHDDDVRFTVGRFEVAPGAINTVPAKVVFTLDLRHPDSEELERLVEVVLAMCSSPRRICGVQCRQVLNSPPVQFDAAVTAVIAGACAKAGIATMTLPSGATHDAKHMAALCPSGMIFIPCRDGISHSDREHADAPNMIQGANILLASIVRLADLTSVGTSDQKHERV